MAETSQSAGVRARPAGKTGEFRDYEERFTATPDPWSEIATLEHGSDRSHASTVRSMVANAEPAQRPAMEAKLLEALTRPGVTDVGRLFVCRMLSLIGSARCVPVVAPLLANPATADAARYALDGIPEPAVDEAYRGALATLSGSAKIGLIGSMALRGDRQASPALLAIQQNPAESAEVRAAAARALGRINAST